VPSSIRSALDAVAGIADGATILVGGFGVAGTPTALMDALIDHGATNLTIVSNNAGNGDRGLAALLAAGRVAKVVPLGNLAERIRAAGAGIGAFLCPTARPGGGNVRHRRIRAGRAPRYRCGLIGGARARRFRSAHLPIS
jgi:acyl CoA:acetate/3-ketoacid CoA transferase alpha subunit